MSTLFSLLCCAVLLLLQWKFSFFVYNLILQLLLLMLLYFSCSITLAYMLFVVRGSITDEIG